MLAWEDLARFNQYLIDTDVLSIFEHRLTDRFRDYDGGRVWYSTPISILDPEDCVEYEKVEFGRQVMPDTLLLDRPTEEETKIEEVLISDGADGLTKVVPGMMVYTTGGGYPYTLARVIAIRPKTVYDPAYVTIRAIHTDLDYNTLPTHLKFVSSHQPEPEPEEEKKPSLCERQNNLLCNLSRAIEKLQDTGHRHDANLLTKLYNVLNLNSVEKEHWWFWCVVAESQDDPQKISYAADMEHADDNRRRRKCSIARFLKGKALEFGTNFSAADSTRIGYLVGTYFPNSYNYVFEVETGEGVYEAYSNSPSSWGSCMSGTRYVRWYANSPDKVAIVKVMLDGKFWARALLWTSDDGKKILDRVYPSDNGPHTVALHYHAVEQGWDYKTSQSSCDGHLRSDSYDYVVSMNNKESDIWDMDDGWPYLDTFKYTDDNPKKSETVVLNLNDGKFRFLDACGGFEDPGAIYCAYCEEEIDEDDERMTHRGDNYCLSCFEENFVEVDYMFGGRRFNNTYHIDDIVTCHICSEERHFDHVVNVGEHGDPYCESCLAEKTAKCCYCKNIAEKEEIIEVRGKLYCEDCLHGCKFCRTCKTAIPPDLSKCDCRTYIPIAVLEPTIEPIKDPEVAPAREPDGFIRGNYIEFRPMTFGHNPFRVHSPVFSFSDFFRDIVGEAERLVENVEIDRLVENIGVGQQSNDSE